MRRGVILELQDGRAVVLDGSGRFRQVPAQPGWRPGDVVPLPGRKPYLWGGLAACLLAVLIGCGAWLWLKQTALVSLDINPSAELRLNRFGRVISTQTYNDAGADLLAETDVRGMTAQDALFVLLNSGAEFLMQADCVTLTVQSDSDTLGLLSQIEMAASAAVPEQTQVICRGVNSALVEEAHSYGVTAGKYLALLDLQSADPSIDMEQYAHCGIDEIIQETERRQAENMPAQSGQDIQAADGGCWEGGHHGGHHR